MINESGIHHKLEISDSTARTLRKRFNDGTSISLDKMEELLEKAGYSVKQEKLWEKK